jgi:hypothetical protein
MIGRADHICSHGLSDTCIALARNWSAACTHSAGKHELCGKPDVPLLPNRVIKVSSSDADMKLHISLRDEKARYCALSHCWGGSSPLTTTKSNLTSHTAGLPAPLPRTFSDAAAVTRALGVEYLWIDSICIVQDSTEDWASEAAKMADVYQNAFVTICADAAIGSNSGFLDKPVRYPQPYTKLVYPKPAGDGSESTGAIYVRLQGRQIMDLPYHG